MPVVPWFCYGNICGATDLTGAVVEGSTVWLGTNVGTVFFVPATVLDAAGITDPSGSIGWLTFFHRFFYRCPREGDQ